ncbi:MFS-type transporter SLC18B1-like isoform X2 [Dermacentor variabilis]|uniref:MFS-type transporter SLC18B1-like isoform X2 n=1 Tax=Dermacentor variabilis TaxID=34621 RepID=UPI003F5C6791
MHSIQRSRTRTVEMTAVAPLSENDADTMPEEVVLSEKITELRTQEREDTKPPARSRVLRRFPILALYGTACFSLAFISPYIPHLAAEKRAEHWQFNIMYASTRASMLLGSLLNTALVQRLTPQTTLIVAFIGMIVCVSFYGSTYWIGEGSSFVGTTVTIGTVFGFFYAFFVVTLYAAATFRSQRSCGIIISSMECVYGISNTVGFLVGTALIEWWPDGIPFFISGGFMFLVAPFILLRSPAKSIKIPIDQPDQSAIRLLSNAPMFISVANVAIAISALGFHDGTLEFHLKEGEFRLPDIEVAAVFSALYISYSLGALFWGYFFTYKMEQEDVSVLLGFMIMAGAFLFVGPAPFLPIQPYLWIVYLTQAMIGFGAAAVVVASYSLALKKAMLL